MLTPHEAPTPRKKERLDVIYKPEGKADEYAQGWACNLGIGCPHMCRYCYVPGLTPWKRLKKPREEFRHFRPKENIIPRFERDCSRLFLLAGEKPVSIFFSFTHDPFCEACAPLMRECLRIMHRFHIGATILTKAVLTPGDIELLARLPFADVGITLTTTDSWMRWEPNAPNPWTRVNNLRMAKDAGLSTWVSCEPILGVDELRESIRISSPWADRYALGRLNHNPYADEINYRLAIQKAVEVLERAGKTYVVKEGSR